MRAVLRRIDQRGEQKRGRRTLPAYLCVGIARLLRGEHRRLSFHDPTGSEQIEKQPETAVFGKFYPVNDKSTCQQQDSHRNTRIATAIAIRLYAADIGRNHQLYLYGKNVCFQSRAQWWRKQVRHHGFIAQPDGR